MAIKIGENVGPYRVTEQLGQGGMATVYKAFHAALDRNVALKVLHPAFNEDQTFIGRFEREAKVVAKLEHPNIVPIYDYAEHESQPYLVMKFIAGETLKARFNRGPLSTQEIENVIDSVGSALAYAHKQGILHRDIKPSNVLLSPEGTMYLADFGLARIASAGESTLSADSIMGTPQYISPEQAMGKKDLDAGTDIYSFGVMLYELVVGQVPFSADTPFSIIHDHIYTPLPLPVDINPNVPESVQNVLLKALAKERSDRYETVDDMVRAFKSAWVSAGVPMQGTSIKMKPPKLDLEKAEAKTQGVEKVEATVAAKVPKKSRSPLIWIGLVLISILCIGGVLYGAWQGGLFAQFLPADVAVDPTVVVAEPIATLRPPKEIPPGITPPPNAPNVLESPELRAAREAARINPDDSRAQLNFSLALYDNGQIDVSMQELVKAAELAGPRDVNFYLLAAQEFKDRAAWIPSASMYLRLTPLIGQAELPPEYVDNLHEAIYRASENKEFRRLIPNERIAAYDEALSLIAYGRFELYNGSAEQAGFKLEAAREIREEMGEASLLQAEIELKAGNTNNAKALMETISGYAQYPAWVRDIAADFYNSIQ